MCVFFKNSVCFDLTFERIFMRLLYVIARLDELRSRRMLKHAICVILLYKIINLHSVC